jgi:pantoate--beta-alanine ligase
VSRHLQVAHTVGEMRRVREAATATRRTIGFVPTMGYLHEGHLSLVDVARQHSDLVVLSIYVNPTQFAVGEDLAEYPRDLERDLELAGSRGVDVAFVPSDDEMYPEPQSVWVEPPEHMARLLCGSSRPTHFRGVLTVVAKLFGIVRPDMAVVGRKDYQQAVLIQRMVRELHLPIRIELAPVVREPGGIAMSSRNAHVARKQRGAALGLSQALRGVRKAFRSGERSAEILCATARESMEAAGVRVDYVGIVDPEDLSSVSEAEPTSVCAVAGWVGATRLIDNASLAGRSSLDDSGA